MSSRATRCSTRRCSPGRASGSSRAGATPRSPTRGEQLLPRPLGQWPGSAPVGEVHPGPKRLARASPFPAPPPGRPQVDEGAGELEPGGRTAERVHRRTGARPRRFAVSGAGALTASERRVARLAAGGLTNRGIAQELFVTTATVETHLRHAFQKLDVSAREQLAGALDRDVSGSGGDKFRVAS